MLSHGGERNARSETVKPTGGARPFCRYRDASCHGELGNITGKNVWKAFKVAFGIDPLYGIGEADQPSAGALDELSSDV